MTRYVDCSSHNGTPNLNAYRNAGHTDLMMKATEGTGYAWDQMPALARAWHALGGRVGYYHWLHGDSPQAQAAWFVRAVTPVFKPGDWLMLDFEEVTEKLSDSQWLATMQTFLSLIPPAHVYTGNWYLAGKPLCAAYLRARPVVLADYAHRPPLNPYALQRVVAHQFTDNATVAGFANPVDYNEWLLSPPPPPPVPTPIAPRKDIPEMVIIMRANNNLRHLLYSSGKVVQLTDAASVHSFMAAGVPVATVAEADFQRIIASAG